MKKYILYGVPMLLLFTAIVVTANIMKTEEVTFDVPFEEGTTIATTTEDEDVKEAVGEVEVPEVPVTPTPKPIVVTPPPATKQCHTGGCSGQLCTSEPGMASTCEWREEYACYKTAKCEVQSSGNCGWTPTAELNACLAN